MRANQWASGEPSGRDGGECVIVSTDVSTGRAVLKSHNCNDSLPFICKFGAPSEFSFSYWPCEKSHKTLKTLYESSVISVLAVLGCRAKFGRTGGVCQCDRHLYLTWWSHSHQVASTDRMGQSSAKPGKIIGPNGGNTACTLMMCDVQ